MDEQLLARHRTLSEEDLAAVSKRRRPETRLGFAVQLCYLRFPGRPLRSRERPPRNLLGYVAAQLGETPSAFDEYAKGRDTTRREHLVDIVRAFGFRPFGAEARRELYECLLPVAMTTDRGTALVEAAIEEMRALAIVSPAITTVEELCWAARRDARESVLRKLTADLSPEARGRLDDLLEVPQGGSRAPLVWLREPPSSPGPKNFRRIVDRLEFARDLGLPPDPRKGIHNNRLAQLAREGACKGDRRGPLRPDRARRPMGAVRGEHRGGGRAGAPRRLRLPGAPGRPVPAPQGIRPGAARGLRVLGGAPVRAPAGGRGRAEGDERHGEEEGARKRPHLLRQAPLGAPRLRRRRGHRQALLRDERHDGTQERPQERRRVGPRQPQVRRLRGLPPAPPGSG
jgi:hypothetical protein